MLMRETESSEWMWNDHYYFLFCYIILVVALPTIDEAGKRKSCGSIVVVYGTCVGILSSIRVGVIIFQVSPVRPIV